MRLVVFERSGAEGIRVFFVGEVRDTDIQEIDETLVFPENFLAEGAVGGIGEERCAGEQQYAESDAH